MAPDPLFVLAGIPAFVPYAPYVLALFGLCAAVMPWLPVPGAGQPVYRRVYGVVNALAHNYRNAANAALAAAKAAAPSGSTPGP
ncbi:hypothetical protein [Acidisphaera rubrifaciens]|uniref:Uncharacterized protein n=1 Tax=Acidisphaera rubrifaciens HS-AP3 TaxID=1231350 RepID=A0A0D6P812_9PROT|nr:hypothetical protein [Acidisphaera rubrifaciens]GAN77004.1 hypothetical protein Asru_0216_02 [Acidisphaera rubrifaciens HS-AP3]